MGPHAACAKLSFFLFVSAFLISCSTADRKSPFSLQAEYLTISRESYHDRLQGFWLGQCIANWTGLVTEMDKIGGDGIHGQFYTRQDWGTPDQPSIWGEGVPSNLSSHIDWVFEDKNGVWGADDDTDIEYMYQYLMFTQNTTKLSAEQIRDGWLKHIYSDDNTPHLNPKGEPENFLWISNQRAHDLMREGYLPPATGLPQHNEHYDMIDAQLTNEIFGFFAPGRPDIALDLAYLPVRTTAYENAAWATEFYIIMYSLASKVDPLLSRKQQIYWMAEQARQRLPNHSYSAHMYDFVKQQHAQGKRWEDVRDAIYQRYQIEQQDGYDITSRNLYCNGCFASGINFAASIISLLYGEGDFKHTIKLAVLMGWDSDNPAATWGGLLGFMEGKNNIEKLFNRKFSDSFNIHRTRANFPNDGIDTFPHMADQGIAIIDRVVTQEMQGKIDHHNNRWIIPVKETAISAAQENK